jgi:hypothetical protein
MYVVSFFLSLNLIHHRHGVAAESYVKDNDDLYSSSSFLLLRGRQIESLKVEEEILRAPKRILSIEDYGGTAVNL